MLEKTARESYNVWADEVDKQIDTLKKALMRHRVKFNGDDKNRGYVGDLIQVRNELKDVISFMHEYVE